MSDAQASVLKRIAQWTVVLGTAGAGFGALGVISYYAWSEHLVPNLLRDHIRAVVGLPMAAVSAFCLVVILEATSGKIEFEALGFKFRGASGPVVLWVLCFLVFVLAIRVLW